MVDLLSRMDASIPSIALETILSTLWCQACTASPTFSSSSARITQGSSTNIDTGAHPGDGASLHTSLLNLIDRRVSGSETIALFGLLKAGVVAIIHSLFTVQRNNYNMVSKLWGILGAVLEDGLPSLVSILPINLSTIGYVYGTPMEECESHITGLCSTLQRDLDTSTHTVSSKTDNGATLIYAWGLVIIPALAASLFLELPSPITIAEAAFRLVPHLICSSYLHAIDISQWLQASFTARPGGDFITGSICTRRTLEIASPIANSPRHTQLMAHLEVSFHGRYAPTQPTTYRKEEPCLPVLEDPPSRVQLA